MNLYQIISIFLLTILYAAMFLYGIIKLGQTGLSAILAKKNRIKNIVSYIIYFFLLSSPEYILPDDLQQSIIYGMWTAFGITPILSFQNTIKKKKNSGELISKSHRLSNTVFLYFALLFAILEIAFIIFCSIAIITNPQEHIQEVFDIKVDWRIFYSIVLLGMLNATFFLITMTLQKVEIRQQGIIFLNSLIQWKDVVSYSWLNNNQDLLEIECKFINSKTRKYKIAVFDYEKKEIEAIFQDKITA